MKHVVLILIIACSVWALWPPAEGKTEARIGTSVTVDPDQRASVKYVLRVNPGPLYLPGVIPENATRPVEGILQVAADFQQRFPDTKIEFVGVPAGIREWLVTQVASAQAPDVIQINVEDVWQDVQKNWYVPLDRYLDMPNPFVPAGQPGSGRWWDLFKYPKPTQGTRAPDGHMYCVVLDMIETGIFYNKTMFRKLGLSEPRDWAEFLDVQRKLREAGVTPMLVDRQCLTDWGVDLIFEQVYGELRPLLDLNYDPRRGEYLAGYLDWDEIIFLHRKGFFKPTDPRWREVWRVLKEWRQYMARDLASTDFHRSFVTQQGAMFWSTSMTVNRLVKDPNLAFDWGVFYLPAIPRSYSRFCDGHPQVVIGGSAMQYSITNSALADTPGSMPFEERVETSERLKRVVAFLQLLTTPKHCDTVVNEVIAFLPNIKGVPPRKGLEPFDEFLQRDYSMTKWYFTFDLRFDEVLVRMLELYMNGGMDEEEFLGWMERNIVAASENIMRRKGLDLSKLEAEWERRAPMRGKYGELPAEAN